MQMEEIAKTLKEMEEAEGFSKVELHAKFELLQEERLNLTPGQYVDRYEELLRWECELAREEEKKKNPYHIFDKVAEVKDFLRFHLVCGADTKELFSLALKTPFLIVWDIVSTRVKNCIILINESMGTSWKCRYYTLPLHFFFFRSELFQKPQNVVNATVYHELAHLLLNHIGDFERQEREANCLAGKWSME